MTNLPTVDQLRDPAQYRQIDLDSDTVTPGMVALDHLGNVWLVSEASYSTGSLLWRDVRVGAVVAWRAGRGHEFYAQATAEKPEYDHEPCCTACGGQGNSFSGGACSDCLGTGHPHEPNTTRPHVKDGELVMVANWQTVAPAYVKPGDVAVHRNSDRAYVVSRVTHHDGDSMQWATTRRPQDWRSPGPYYFVRNVEQPGEVPLDLVLPKPHTEPSTVQIGVQPGQHRIEVHGDWPIVLGVDTGLQKAIDSFEAVNARIKALLQEASDQLDGTEKDDRRWFGRNARVQILSELDKDLRRGLQNLWVVQRRPYVLDAGSMLVAAQYATAAGVAHRVLHSLAAVLVDADPDLLVLATTGKRKELH